MRKIFAASPVPNQDHGQRQQRQRGNRAPECDDRVGERVEHAHPADHQTERNGERERDQVAEHDPLHGDPEVRPEADAFRIAFGHQLDEARGELAGGWELDRSQPPQHGARLPCRREPGDDQQRIEHVAPVARGARSRFCRRPRGDAGQCTHRHGLIAATSRSAGRARAARDRCGCAAAADPFDGRTRPARAARPAPGCDRRAPVPPRCCG